MKKTFLFTAVSVVALAFSGVVQGAPFEMVDIGNAGNADDTDASNPYGGVSYTYKISKYEISADQFNQAAGAGDTIETGSNPALGISFVEAARYCNWLTSGNVSTGAYTIAGGQVTAVMSRVDILASGELYYVLPSIDEWYKAAYFNGSGYSTYTDGTSNPGDPPTAGSGEFNYNNAIGSPWSIVSGLLEQNGTKNMMGNAWEWTETEEVANTRIVTGGSYVTSLGDTRLTLDIGEAVEGSEVGFRVVAVPEPATISFMGLSTISLFFTRAARRRKLAGKSLFPIDREFLCDSYMVDVADEGNEQTEPGIGWALFEGIKEGVFLLGRTACHHMHFAGKLIVDRMALVHERGALKAKEIKSAMKQKIIRGFDAFLALIMK